MKKNSIWNLVLLFNVLIPISCQNNYKVETEIIRLMLECSGEEKEFYETFSQIETGLIEQGILASNEGESYYHIFQTIAEQGDINFKFKPSLKEFLKHNQFNQFVCNDSLTLEKFKKFYTAHDYKDSRIAILQKRLNTLYSNGTLDISIIAQTITEVLSPKDFNHIYYKFTTISLLIATQDTDSGLPRRLPKPTVQEKKDIIDERNLVQIIIKDNKVKVGEAFVDLKELTFRIEEYLSVKKTDKDWPEFVSTNVPLIGECIVSQVSFELKSSNTTRCDYYLEVQNSMIMAYNNVREKMAMTYFHKSYSKLNSEEQASIKQIVPQRITESEPESKVPSNG